MESDRSIELEFPAQRVWDWILDTSSLGLFQVNLFHARAQTDASRLEVGSRVDIWHRLGLRKELRVARIARLEPYEISWSEVKAEGSDGFPHYQSFRLEPLGQARCRLHNHLRGTLHLFAARLWLLWWYRPFLPRILDLENRAIERALRST